MASTDVVPRSANERGRRARAAILEAATALFAARGFEGVSIADVAEASGATKPAVLYHFAGKDALWRECVETLWEQVEAFYAREWPRHLPPSRALVERALDVYIEAALRWPAYVRIPFIEGATPSWRSEWLVDRHFGVHVRSADSVLRELQARGLLPAGDPAHLQNLLSGPINVYLSQSAMWARAFDRSAADADFLRSYARLAVELTFRSGFLDRS